MPTKTPCRYGMYYSPVAGPYRQADLEAYLPVLQAMGARWLVLRSTATRAVPEGFLQGLLQADITPIIHFALPLATPLAEVQPLLRAYARWGVKHILLFDRPNQRAAWGAGWHQPDLPGRFLDAFIPLAAAAAQEGLTPFFPPLEPGGDYWDLAFLRASLEGLRRRNPDLAAQIGITAYAWSEGKPLDWGKGGPEVWPEAQPYHTPPSSQDHRGFYIFDWYALEARAALGRVPPIFLAGMGSRYGREAAERVETKNVAIARACRGNHLAESVIGGAFYVLTAPAEHSDASAAWLDANGKPSGMVQALTESNRPKEAHAAETAKKSPDNPPLSQQPYVLLPRFADGLPSHYLNAALPWLQSGTATVGFQIEEALQAAEIIIIGQPEDYAEEIRTALLEARRPLQWIPLNGTDVAQNVAQTEA